MLIVVLSIASLSQPFEMPSLLLDAPAPAVTSEVTMLPAELLIAAQDDPAAQDTKKEAHFSYTYIEIGGSTLNPDDSSVTSEDVDTYYLKGSLRLGMFHLFAAYDNQSVDFLDTEANVYRLGAGVHFGLGPKIDLIGEAAWLYNDLSSDLASIDEADDGFEGRVGLRWMPLVWGGGGLELDGNFLYIDVGNRLASDDTGSGGEVGARVHFLRLFSIGGMYSIVDDDDIVSLNARLSF